MNWLPTRQGLGVVSGGGCRGRGLRSAALVTVYFGVPLVLAACNPGNGPQTGPGLEPPEGQNAAMYPGVAIIPGNSNGGFGNTGNTNSGTSAPATPAGTGGAPSGMPTTMNMGSAGMGGTNPGAPQLGSGGASGGAMGMPADSGSCSGGATYSAALGLHLVVDDSLGMVVPRNLWQPLGDALDAWTASDTMASTQLAAQLFAGECSPDAYAAISVPIGNAAEQAAALDAQMSSSMHGFGAATAVALGAVSSEAEQWNADTHGNAAIVLISGSEPTACDTIDAATAATSAASSALALPQAVPTYVLAMRGLPTLDAIAAAGGTGAAHMVDDPTSSDALVDAMTAIADEARCRVALPSDASTVPPEQVNLELMSSDRVEPLVRVENAEACQNALGWYYDDVNTRRFAILCPSACADLRSGGKTVTILVCG
jgi:hypothetical protein